MLAEHIALYSMITKNVMRTRFIFFQAHKVDSFAYKQIFQYLPNITHRGDGIPLRPLPLLSLLPVNLNDYYRYEGSLTHPPCAENVIWTVFTDYIFISHDQVEANDSFIFKHFKI